ncbi:MAG: hypothetical protein LBB67_03010 [Oscillospiraceae bacterium]|nr:hypothetical protein [Oscillospiraceae bacterium]
MKTRKIMSVLLAMAIVFASVGVLSASALDNGFELTVTGTGWEYKEVSYTLPEDIDVTEVAYDWLVTNSKGATLPLTNKALGLTSLMDSAANTLVLVVQPGDVNNYDKLSVTLTANGAISETVSFWLVDDTAFVAALAETKELAANKNDRYSEDFIESVNEAITAAEEIYAKPDVTPDAVAAAIAALEAARSEKVYALTGIDFLDDFLVDYVADFWSCIDKIAAPFAIFESDFWASIQTLISKVIAAFFTFDY